MTDQNLLFDVRTRSGIEFPEMRLDQLQGLVNDGTLQGDDMVMVCGDKRQRWFPLGRVDGLKVSAVGGQWQDDAAPPAPSSGGSTLLLASLGGVFVVLLLAVAVIAYVRFSGSGDPPVMEVVVEDTQGSESASATPSEPTPGNPSRFEASVAEITALIDRATAARDEGRFDDADVDIKQALALIERYDLILDTKRIPLEARLDVLGETIDEARAAAAVAAAVPDEVNISDWYDRHHRAVPFLLKTSSAGKPLSSGSGFVVEYGSSLYLVTNRHCIRDGADILAWHFSANDGDGSLKDFFTYEDVPFATSQFLVPLSAPAGPDIAVCDITLHAESIQKNGIVPLVLADPDDVTKGQELFWLGHPTAKGEGSAGNQTLGATDVDSWSAYVQNWHDPLKITNGDVSTTKFEDGTYVIVTDDSMNRGNSGGPVMRQSDGAVVGVVTYGWKQIGGERNVAVRSRHIIETINNGKRWDPATMGSNSIELVEPEEPDFLFIADDCDLELPFIKDILEPDVYAELGERWRWIHANQNAVLIYCRLVSRVRSNGTPVTFSLESEFKERGFGPGFDQIYVLAIPYRDGSDIDLELLDASGLRVKQPKRHGFELVGDQKVTTRILDMEAEPFALGWALGRRTTSNVRFFEISNKGEETTDVLLLIYGRSLD